MGDAQSISLFRQLARGDPLRGDDVYPLSAVVQKRMVVGMITLEDCVAFCGLTEEEVLAIAEHEHMPEIAAAALAEYLIYQEHGTEKIRDMIVDDIRASQARNDRQHVLTLLHVLHNFLRTHPEARPEQHPWSGRF